MTRLIFADNFGGVLLSFDSNLTIISTIFSKNYGLRNGTIIYSSANSLCSASFSGITIIQTNISAIYIQDLAEVFINNSIFKQTIEINFYSQALIIINSNIIIQNAKIINFRYESAVSLIQGSRSCRFLFNNIQFQGNQAIYSGAAIHIKGFKYGIVKNSLFYNNTAELYAGAVLYKCEDKDCSLVLESCNFIENKAHTYAAVIKYDHLLPYLKNNSFRDNLSPRGSPSLVGYPINMMIFQTDDFNLNKLLSYIYTQAYLFESAKNKKRIKIEDFIDQHLVLVIVLLDELENILLNENDSEATIRKSTDDKTLIFVENGKARFNNGTAIFKDLQIIGRPGSVNKLVAEYNNKYDLKSFSLDIEVEFRNCNRGEVLSAGVCKSCQKNFFIILDPSKAKFDSENNTLCEACPQNAFCPGGHVVLPIKNYWLRNENQTRPLKCLVENSCKNIEPDSIKDFKNFIYVPECNPGYYGNLCNNCERGFGRSSNRECVKCSTSNQIYIKFFLLATLTILFLVYQSRSAFSITILDSKRRALIKILVDHISYLSFISRFDVPWSAVIHDFFALNDQYVSTAPKEIFSFDCFISEYINIDDIYYFNAVLVSLSPFIYGAIALATIYIAYTVLFIVKKLSRKSITGLISFDKNLLSICLVVFYNFYPRLLINSFGLMKCIEVDEGPISYLEGFTELPCWEVSTFKRSTIR